MTAQLLDYPTASRVRIAPARKPGVTVAPHRDAARRSLGPARHSWVRGAATPTGGGQGGAGTPVVSVDLDNLHWTPRALLLMVCAVMGLGVAMVITLVSVFFAVSDAPLQPASAVAVLVQGAAR